MATTAQLEAYDFNSIYRDIMGEQSQAKPDKKAKRTENRPTSHDSRGSVSPSRISIGGEDERTSDVAYQAMGIEQAQPTECCQECNSCNKVFIKTLVVIATIALLATAIYFTGGMALAAFAIGSAPGIKAFWVGLAIYEFISLLGAAFILPSDYHMGTDTGHNCKDSASYVAMTLLFLFDGLGRAIDCAREVTWWNCMLDPTSSQSYAGCPSCSDSPSCQNCDVDCRGCDCTGCGDCGDCGSFN